MSTRNGGSASRAGATKFENYSNSTSKFSPSSSLKSKLHHSTTAASSLRRGSRDYSTISGRVRVAVRLRPRNSEEMIADADFADCVELQPELKRLKLQKNNWDSDTYEFDEVLTEYASQKRVYEVVAKPVVESVLDGYNGTVMAYGQTGTGKTYTLGRLGEEDAAGRGIMLRAMEDILEEVSPENDSVSVSYYQLYMETIQDLLNPSNDNITIVEDPKNGDVSLPGATLVQIRDHKSFMELLQLGEAHRFATNTKLNTESSRSHAILMIHVKRSVKGKDSSVSTENGNRTPISKTLKPPVIRRSKLVIVDLAGSERIDKSGSEGHTLEEAKYINLSLSALGKCINALAENSAHVPVRDSKLTRLLRDSFGGTARTSLVITIGPSPRHRGETSSTISFGQRAMKVENMVKLKEEFDYKSLSRRLEMQLDKLTAEHERQQKAFDDEIERITLDGQKHIAGVEQNYSDALEVIVSVFKFSLEKYNIVQLLNKAAEEAEIKIMALIKNQNEFVLLLERMKSAFNVDRNLQFYCVLNSLLSNLNVERVKKLSLTDKFFICRLHSTDFRNFLFSLDIPPVLPSSDEVTELMQKLKNEILLRNAAEAEILKLGKRLEDEECEKAKLEEEIKMLQSQLLQISFEADQAKHQQLREPADGDKASVVKLFEQVGLHKILSLLQSDDADVRIHAVKVVANLAAEESNQEKIVQAGGLTSLLELLRSSNDETIHRVAAGAIANLAMNETNQELIMAQGGISLLSLKATKTEDPQTLRMVAGAIANLCGNDKLQVKLRGEGGIRALVEMVRCRHPDVLAQVARGMANFAKCESRASTQGTKTGRSVLIEEGALPWIVQNANNDASPIRRHIELALCHLAQHEVNARDMIHVGALWELVRISRDCSREDIRVLAQRTLKSTSGFQAELKRLR
ncbi:hypothetical protein SASPL_130968 [Salvia splendens]|uniref:Kinesin-like protein n=1 Tax=Salvia splendens TaxID=180675 RepID=A0A8X8ZK64_SALSN|nr:hypothetical protein SASPL_130968 [Salvia splendens]